MDGSEITEMLTSRYVLFSCEGTAEAVIIGKLYDGGCLVVPAKRVVEDTTYYTPYTRVRKAGQIAQRFLGTSYAVDGASSLLIARIVDSRSGRFVLPKRWSDSCVVERFFTRPEIEMLAIHAEGGYEDWRRQSRRNRQLRPSEFCKGDLGLRDIKSFGFLDSYWTADKLVRAIRAYDEHRDRSSGELSLGDLLK